MKNTFENIVKSLRIGEDISVVTADLKANIKTSLDISRILLAYIDYLKTNFLSDVNRETFDLIDQYLSHQVSLKAISQTLFLNKIEVDQDKKEGHQAQFIHCPNETFFDKILRVLFEFTRNDLNKPKGVCFDFCMFIVGLSFASGEKREIFLWNSIEKITGENNFILFCIEGNNVLVYDPFMETYLPLDSYELGPVGLKPIDLNGTNILKVSFPLTRFDYNPENIYFYKQIREMFSYIKKDEDEEVEHFLQQNYYQRLEITPDATSEEIRKKYRMLIDQYHPDHNQNRDTLKIAQAIIEAYRCLKDDSLRKAYDTKLAEAENAKSQSAVRQENSKSDDVENFIHEVGEKCHFNGNAQTIQSLKKLLSRPKAESNVLFRDVDFKNLKIIKEKVAINNTINDLDFIDTYQDKRL